MPGLWRLGQGAWKGGSGNEADSRQNNRPHCSRGGRPPPSSGGHGSCPGGALPAAADAGSWAGEWAGPPSRVPSFPEPHRQHRQASPPLEVPAGPCPLAALLAVPPRPAGQQSGVGVAARGEPGPAARPRNPGITPEGGSHWWLTVFGNHRNRDLTYIFKYGPNSSFPSRNQSERV